MTGPDDVLDELRRSFCRHAEGLLSRIDELLRDAAAGDDPAVLVELVRHWHRLKGAGGTVGLPVVTEIAGRIEAILKRDIEPGSTLPEADLAFVRGGVRIVSDIVAEAGGGEISDRCQQRGRLGFQDLSDRLGFTDPEA